MKTAQANLRPDRADVAIGAACRNELGRRAFVALIDLNASGCCLFSRANMLSVGGKVTIHPEGLAPIKATVQWQAGSLAGVRFESPLYPAVADHLARTHPWRLSETAKGGLDREVAMPAVVVGELTRMLDRAEKAFKGRGVSTDILTTRPPIIGSRPGTAAQSTDHKVMRLFLS